MAIPYCLHEMTSAEVRGALPEIELAIIPTGATEQHGPNLTTEVDTRLALEVAKRVAASVHPRAIATSTLPLPTMVRRDSSRTSAVMQ